MPTMRKQENLALPSVDTWEKEYRWDRNTPAHKTVGGQLTLPSVWMQDLSWRDKAICTGSGLNFVPTSSSYNPDEEACKALCHSCPVKEECLQWALEADDRFAICGGYTYKERRALKR